MNMFATYERDARAAVLGALMDQGPRQFFMSGNLAAAWWLVAQGLVIHRDGIFRYVGPVKAEAVAS